MRLFWGGYGFPVNSAAVTSQADAIMSPQGVPLRYRSVYSVEAVIDGTGQADLSARENQLRNALVIPFQDLVLRTDTGGASSAALYNQNSLTGTRVTNFAFRESQGAEFVNRRTVSFTVEAEYLVPSGANAVISWTEQITIRGNGGPLYRWRYPVNTPGVVQRVTPYSAVFAVQSGSAVGHIKQPRAPLPRWAAPILKNETVTIGQQSPELVGRAYINYGINWSYEFERGDGPLVALPSLPPGVI